MAKHRPSAQMGEILAQMTEFAQRSGILGEKWDVHAYRGAIDDVPYPMPAETVVTDLSIGGMACKLVRAPGADDGRRMLYLHGGGMVAGDFGSHRTLVGWLSYYAGCTVLFPEYRLAPEHPYPAPLEDAAAAWAWLRRNPGSGAARQLTIAGDSAGAGLALALMVLERDRGGPLPDAALLICPMLNWDAENAPALKGTGFRRGMARAYYGDLDPRDPLISPVFAAFHGLPPILVHGGGADGFLPDAEQFAERAGPGVELDIWEDLPHAWHRHAPFVPEANAALARAGTWLKGLR